LRELERAIILLLLSDGPTTPYPSARLGVELGAEAQTLEQALAGLARSGVVRLDGGDVSLSPAARHIDELGLIGI
jgi:hypothetical protein